MVPVEGIAGSVDVKVVRALLWTSNAAVPDVTVYLNVVSTVEPRRVRDVPDELVVFIEKRLLRLAAWPFLEMVVIRVVGPTTSMRRLDSCTPNSVIVNAE